MADFLLKFNSTVNSISPQFASPDRLDLGSLGACWISGVEGTFDVVRDGEDAIAALGYVCFIDGISSRDTLVQILRSFHESQIVDLKKRLIGQYLLVIKKGDLVYLFADFIGGRNIFYSVDDRIISSSYSLMEDRIGANAADLDIYKVLEFLAVKQILYPSWLGRSTAHKRIKWLLPYEYLVVDPASSGLRLGSIVYSFDNSKQATLSELSGELLSKLSAIVERPEFKKSSVAASLSGGRDSRLIAGLASRFYPRVHYRIAYAEGHYDSMKDMAVARKLSRIQEIALDVYRFQPDRDEDKFREITEGFTPSFNNKITPLIEGVGAYALGFGGVFGTELFMPIPWKSIDEFIQVKIERAKQALHMNSDYWKIFRSSLQEEFKGIQIHYELSDMSDQDYIRLFGMLDTARYASHILSAFNRFGFQLEPYGSYPIMDLALRVPSSLWGNHRRLGGDAKIQQAAMNKLNPKMAHVLTYKNYRPMMPLTFASFPIYLKGVSFQAGDILRRKLDRRIKEVVRIELPGGYYLSNGWEKNYLDKTWSKYGALS